MFIAKAERITMINKNNVYSECVQLSKESSQDSIKKLIGIYLHSGKEARKTARTAISKTRNRFIVIDLIDKMLENDDVDRFLLLQLGMYLSRERYIKQFLLYCFENKLDLKQIGVFQMFQEKPLSKSEKNIIADYIVETKDFDKQLVKLAGIGNRERILFSAVDCIINNQWNKQILELLVLDTDYLRLIQDELYDAVVQNPEKRIEIARYLDLSSAKNQNLIAKYDNLFTIFSIIKKNPFSGEVPYCNDLYIRVCVNIANKETVDQSDWEIIQDVISEHTKLIGNLDEEDLFLGFLVSATYMDAEFIEGQLIDIYKKTKLYTNKALALLANMKSRFAYREMLSFMLTSEDRKERYKYAVRLMLAYRENSTAIYNYAKELNDDNLLKTLDDVAERHNIQVSFQDKYKDVSLTQKENIQVLPHDTIISEFLFDLAREIDADTFYAAVGFTFSSGLRLLQPLISYIHNKDGFIELITGSLQTFGTNGKNTKIDKSTVLYLNNLILASGLKLYTYTNSFYHGKFYYLAGKQQAYIIIGSSNISKTAFIDNYELDTLISIDIENKSNQFIDWYSAFRSQCAPINGLDADQYDDFKWESELDVFSSRIVHQMTFEEMRQKINELSDEETRFRLNTWLQHNPTYVYSNLNIENLPEYVAFLFADRGLAVFESFIPGNAYYTFKYYDFDVLLQNVATLTKTQMLLSSSFLNRGYHISDKDRLENRINLLFT